MRDPHLERLVAALDRVVEWAGGQGLPAELLHDLDVAEERLRVLDRRLAGRAAASCYLDLLRRLCRESRGGAIAASA